MAFITTTADSISSGGTITGDLTISGDLTVEGSGGAVYDEIIEGSLHIKTAATGGTIADLSYADDLVIEDDGAAGISIRTPDNSSGNIVFQSVTNDTVARILADYGSGSEYLAIEVDGSERMRVTSTGKIGIGVTDPDHTLEIFSTAAQLKLSYDADSFATFAVDASDDVTIKTAASGGFRFQATTDTTDYFQILDADGGIPIFNVDATNERVGIGTATPTRTLALNRQAGDTYLAYELGQAEKWLTGVEDSGATFIIYDFNSTAGYRMKLDANSRISLGNNDLSAVTSTTIFGYLAGQDIASGATHNTYFGSLAGSEQTTGDNNTYIGANAGLGVNGNANNSNVGVGANALLAVATGGANVAVGYNTLAGNDDGADNVAIGHKSLEALTSSNTNVAIGDSAMRYMDDTADGLANCVAVGASAFAGSATDTTTGANGTVAIGKSALTALTSGAGNTAVGYESSKGNTTGARNTAIGYQALESHTDGNDNLAIGYNAMQSADHISTVANVAIGNYALDSIGGEAATRNVAIGWKSGDAVTGGDDNTLVGNQSGDVISSGSQNTIIGAGSDPSANSGANQSVIGYGTTGQADNSVTLGNASVTAVYMASDATSDYVTNTHGATVYAGGLHLKKSQVSHDSGGITSPLVVHNSFDDDPDGVGVGIDWVMSDEIDNNGAVMGRIGIVNASGAIGSGGAGFSGSMQFYNRTAGTLTKQLALNGDDGNYNTTIFAETLSSAVRYGLYLENDGNDPNCYGIQIKAGADDASGTTTYINCADGNGDQIGHISNTSGTFALTDPSDSRLKKNIVDTTLKGVETVDKMKVRDFEWIKSGDKMKAGFIAQELIDAFPSAVTGEDGAMEDILDEDGNKTGERIKPMGVSRDVLVPVLIKAVQELSARVKELEGA